MLTSTLNPVLEAALGYAARNWYVVPLHTPVPNGCSCRHKDCTSIGKHPRTRNGLKDATTDTDLIASWWSMWPQSNIGIVCGPSGLVVIDIDPRHGGDESWQDLVAQHGAGIKDTLTALTGGGGRHLVFLAPGEINIGNVSNSPKYTGSLGVGVDVRANGGYIVATPSLHESGAFYEWEEEREPARLPLALVELLTEPARKDTSEPISAAAILEGVPEGGRDWALFQLASKLRYADVPIDWAYQLIEEAASKSLDDKGQRFSRSEGRKKVESAYFRFPAGKGAFVSLEEAQQAEEEDAEAEWKDWPTFWTADRAESWLCEPFLPRGRQTALYAPAKGGKSELALDIIARLATGQKVLDRPASPPLTVVYLDFEMTDDDLYERLTEMGYGPETDLSHLFYYQRSLPPFDTAAGGARALEIARLHNADLVVIDTLGRTFKGAENDADTMIAYDRCTGTPLKRNGHTILRLDHAGKHLESGQRGTSGKNDDADLVWELTKKEGGCQLRATHKRQNWVPDLVQLVRLEDPILRYERGAYTWPAQTAACAGVITDLGLSDLGARKTREALRGAGHKYRNEVITAAMKWLREKTEREVPEW